MPTAELSELDRHVFAYFISHAAQTLNIDGRFYPYGELVMAIRNKLQLNTSKFGKGVTSRVDPVSRYFLDLLIERGALSDIPQKIGNNMHQFQADAYRNLLRELETSDEIIRAADGKGDDYWRELFTRLM
ncbi:hypothetical protein E4634_00805 [Mangrovimicrobium sediminis]|uniref:Uncharacterized protein n=1 Tax=Mangrovimicrobium sediminis TaxID=2562682 RepID=A0A4Z0M9P3_9GAMM|nr:hypothetical protein [Haliea sp. SAOS-164]TGD76120.1 hypothetical protein E4634_00805 [Haliea sp. SAOS-164]